MIIYVQTCSVWFGCRWYLFVYGLGAFDLIQHGLVMIYMYQISFILMDLRRRLRLIFFLAWHSRMFISMQRLRKFKCSHICMYVCMRFFLCLLAWFLWFVVESIYFHLRVSSRAWSRSWILLCLVFVSWLVIVPMVDVDRWFLWLLSFRFQYVVRPYDLSIWNWLLQNKNKNKKVCAPVWK